MVHKSCLFGLVLFAAFAGCSSGTGGSGNRSGLGENCRWTGDCVVGLVCKGLICVAAADSVSEDGADADLVSGNDAGDGPTCSPNCPEPEGIVWLDIPGGTFKMGVPLECANFSGETLHNVTLSDFAIMAHEVTEAQFEEVMGHNPSENPLGADYPVENVDWSEAVAFCKAIGAKLPTEAQWEYAARGKTSFCKYPCDETDCELEYGWVEHNSDNHKHPVGLQAPNGFGLFDVVGNVEEWVFDWDDPYSTSNATDPSGPPEPFIELKITRGGNYNDDGSIVYRLGISPNFGYDVTGFRCTRVSQ